MTKQHIFVSYSSRDADAVLPIVEVLGEEYERRGMGVDVWVDRKDLRAGQRWDVEIAKALQDSVGMLFFVSPAAMESLWVTQEIAAAAEHQDRLIIPIILSHVQNLPPALARRQWVDLSGRRTEADVRQAAQQIAMVTEAHLRGGGAASAAPPISAADAPAVAANIAQDVRGAQHAKAETVEPPDSVFVVHGHDGGALKEVETYLNELGVKPVVLTRLGGASKSLLEKFFDFASNTKFAVVILSPDDMGASRKQYEADGVGERALQFRARQNVILELGFFYGLLSWENVFVLYRPPEKVFPNFERPSDIDGAVFDAMDVAGKWRELLAGKLKEHGFRLKKPRTRKSAKAAPGPARATGKGTKRRGKE